MGDLESELANTAVPVGDEPAGGIPARSSPKWTWLAGILIIVTAVFGLNHKLITAGATPVWDADGYFGPYYMLVADAARSGHLLLWDPWTTCGTPAGVDPQLGAFSPLMLAFGLITGGTIRGFAAYWLSIWAFGGIGMLILSRRLGAAPWTALVITLGFTFCGVFTVQAQHTSHLVSLAFLPWIVWRLDRAFLDRSWLAAAEAGALLGLSSLSGYPTMTLATAALGVAWAGARCVSRIRFREWGQAWRQGGNAAASIALFGLVSLAIFAPCYAAFSRETEGFTARHGDVGREIAIRHGIGYLNLATSLNPALGAVDTWRAPAPADSPPPQQLLSGDASCTSIYIGLFPLVLAFAGLLARPTDVFRWILFAVMALYLSCAMSKVLPVCGWLYDYVPPLRYSRHAVLFRDYAMFLTLVLAALAASDLTSGPAALRRRLWALLAAGFILAAAAMVIVWHHAGIASVTAPAYHWALPVSVALSLAGAAIGGFGRYLYAPGANARLNQWGWACTSAIVLLAFADGAITYHWNRPFIMTDNPPDQVRWHDLEAGHQASLAVSSAERQQGSIYNNYQVIPKTPSLMGYTVFTNSDYLAMDSNGLLARLAGPSSRFWFAPKAIRADVSRLGQTRKRRAVTSDVSDTPRLHVTRAEDVLPTNASANLSPPPSVLPLPPLPGLDDTTPNDDAALLRHADVEVRRYEPDEMQLSADFQEPGWLLVTDRWSPSWKASVNGHDVPVHIGQRVFRAVQVPAGPCTIDFRFDPSYLRWLIASWMVMGCVAVWSLWAHVVARYRGHRDREAE